MAVPVVSVNSYISIEQANTLIENNYIGNDERRVWWFSLSNDDKGVCLIKSSELLNDDFMFGWVGARVTPDQALAFPRFSDFTGQIDFSYRMCLGLIELIFNLNKTSISESQKMIKDGITSFSDGGGMSIKFSDTLVSNVSKNIISDYASIIGNYFGEVSQYIW